MVMLKSKTSALFILSSILLTSCGNGGPTKKIAQQIMVDNGATNAVVDALTCTPHENGLFNCFISYRPHGNSYTVQKEDVGFRKINGNWEIENFNIWGN